MAIDKEGLGSSHKADSEGKQSFVDVVTRNQKCIAGNVADVGENVINMTWNSGNNEEEWLSRCAVGTLREFTDVSSINGRLRSRGFSFSSMYLWDKCILWVFESEFEREGFIYNRFFWDDKFSSMMRWSDSFNPQSRLAWIDCFGVPLRFWNVAFFNKIGWLLDEPLMVEEDTLLKKRFDRGRVLVLIPLNQSCHNKIKVMAAGLRVYVLPPLFTDHEVEEKKGPEVGGQLKKKDKGDGDQFSIYFGKNKEMMDRLAVNHSLSKPREEKKAVVAIDIGTADTEKKGGCRDIKVKAMYPSSPNDKVDFEIRRGMDWGVAYSNTVDVPLGQQEIVKVGSVESPHEDVSKALMSSGGPTSEKSIGLIVSFLGFEEGVLNGPSDLLGDRFGERCISVGGKSCQELVRESEVAPISVKGVVKVLTVASPSISRRRKWRKSLYLRRSHSMITMSSSACDIKLQQKPEEKIKVVWNLHDEIAKVIERGLARGFDFNGKKNEMLEIIARRGKENDNRFHDLVKRLVSKLARPELELLHTSLGFDVCDLTASRVALPCQTGQLLCENRHRCRVLANTHDTRAWHQDGSGLLGDA
ncbi:hypothetical protein Dsin_020432 [Dipteronia sinensis]|uniref:DUF4283 domain-containing protein n=1 Tax=Dipteronia sinensis TaxID=43782 RepID=A0AAE0AAJ7_9ROSI|nr:hypothetical protein Dsin_020432 [Dipteronia sinensis]